MILAFPKRVAILLTVAVYMLFICLASCTKQPQNIISLNRTERDGACGPRCLWAFMQITGAGNPNCDINCIYGLIGKKPYSATSLKDLKDAAHKLGLSATGYKLGISDLEEMNGYAILPIGVASGTSNDPLHFILVKQISNGYVTIINSRTLESQNMKISTLQESWKGYALLISANNEMKFLHKQL
jgi:ABC-type bacteriocin/lantibiotic exporter with double-glycine peptidase domain